MSQDTGATREGQRGMVVEGARGCLGGGLGGGLGRGGWGWAWVLVGLGVMLGVALVAGIGEGHGPVVGLVAVMGWLLTAGVLAGVYVGASVGMGVVGMACVERVACGVVLREPERLWLAAALGLALMLTVSHGIGWAGGLVHPVGVFGPVVVGLVGLGVVVWRGLRGGGVGGGVGVWLGRPRLRVSTLASVVGVVVMVVASCSMPGWLWGSEFGGFDSLSYHLQLPREWLEGGRIVPLAHNVYSYLPSYMEGAFTHLGAMWGIVMEGGAAGGMLAGDGEALVASQLLHAWCAVLAAGLIGRCADRATRMAGLQERACGAARMMAWAVVLVTPWTVVVGSMAYNEMGMVALGAAGMLVAMRVEDEGEEEGGWVGGWGGVRKGALAGMFVGGACCCKPTALFMVGPVVGLMLLATTCMGRGGARLGGRVWWRAVLGWSVAGCVMGVLMLLPWLVRNWMHGGNPVFPQMTGVFGSAHWTAEQVLRYRAAHHSDLSVLGRFALLVLPTGDPSLPAGMVAQRGLLHAQFFGFLPLVLVAVGGMAMSRWRRRLMRPMVLLVLGGCAQVCAWALLTHLQARFLVPVLLVGSPLVGLAMAMAVSERGMGEGVESVAGGVGGGRRSMRVRRRLLMGALNVGVVVQGAWVVMLFMQQGRGEPNAFLTTTAGELTGDVYREAFEGATGLEREAFAREVSPQVYVNLVLGAGRSGGGVGGDGGLVYLLGDSTALYWRGGLVWHTTYDASPLGELVRAFPGDESRWAAELRSEGMGERGVRYVVLNLSELTRLSERSGWYDPAVTPTLARLFLERHGTLLRAWPELGIGVYRLRDGGSGVGGAGDVGGDGDVGGGGE